MRYAPLLLLAFCLASCSPRPFSGFIVSYGLDFTPYTSRGFLFTPNEFTGPHESVGVLTVEIQPAARVARATEEPTARERQVGRVIYERVQASDALEEMYNDALALGADAVTQIVVEPVPIFYQGVEITGVRVTGFAIDRSEVGT